MEYNHNIRSLAGVQQSMHQQYQHSAPIHLPTSLPTSMVTASMVNQNVQGPHIENPNEVFVGNLSFFCEEQHLLELFQPYSTVTHCRIMRSEDRTRSLLFGFIAFATHHEMIEMCKLFNGHVFFGRRLRVQPSSNRSVVENIGSELGLQIHLSIASAFPPDQIIRPTEQLLLKYFMHFGSISDVQVNCYTVHAMPSKQEGYAFITFEDHQTVERIVSNPRHMIHGITVMCAKSNRKPKRILQPNPARIATQVVSFPATPQSMLSQPQHLHANVPAPSNFANVSPNMHTMPNRPHERVMEHGYSQSHIHSHGMTQNVFSDHLTAHHNTLHDNLDAFYRTKSMDSNHFQPNVNSSLSLTQQQLRLSQEFVSQGSPVFPLSSASSVVNNQSSIFDSSSLHSSSRSSGNSVSGDYFSSHSSSGYNLAAAQRQLKCDDSSQSSTSSFYNTPF